MRAAAFLLAMGAGPLAAQQEETPQKPNVIVISPTAEQSLFRFPQAERVKAVDIPQWAKDEGHNGVAVYTAIVAPDDTLIRLELRQSSGSAAIDAAVRARAETLWYRAGTDTAGNPMKSRIPVRMEYARYDKDSPGGGIGTYTCGDLVREYDWLLAADPARENPFLPELVHVTLQTAVRLERGERVDTAIIDADIAAGRATWPTFVERCRANPERLLLDEVDHPETYRRQIESY